MRRLVAILLLAAEGTIQLENPFLRVLVNADPQETARFSLQTTGGDPETPGDDGVQLLFGTRKPWTSYTTVWLDGQLYLFGGPTRRRAGRGLPPGKVVLAPVAEGNAIRAQYAFPEGITITQVLQFTENPSTGRLDALEIRYTAENRDSSAHEVGLRILLDTMLGENDAAPIYARGEAVERERCWEGAEVPDSVQVMDSLVEPRILALLALPPPRPALLHFANWGDLADYAWRKPCEEGKALLRTGEDVPDSALAVLWEPEPLAPRETRSYRLLIGILGLTRKSGALVLGLTGPSQLTFLPEDPPKANFSAFVQVQGELKARAVRLRLFLPEGLELVRGQMEVPLGDIPPEGIRQAEWTLQPNGQRLGALTLRVRAESATLPAQEVSRKLLVQGPIALEAEIQVPEVRLEGVFLEPNPLPVEIRLRNPQPLSTGAFRLRLRPPPGFQIRPPETRERWLRLAGGASEKLRWLLWGDPRETVGTAPVILEIRGPRLLPLTVTREFLAPSLVPRLVLRALPPEPRVGDYFALRVSLTRANEFRGAVLRFRYSPEEVRFLRYSEGYAGRPPRKSDPPETRPTGDPPEPGV